MTDEGDQGRGFASGVGLIANYRRVLDGGGSRVGPEVVLAVVSVLVFVALVVLSVSRLSSSALLVPGSLSGPAAQRQPDLKGRPWRSSSFYLGQLEMGVDLLEWRPDPKWTRSARPMAWRRAELEAVRYRRYSLQPGVEIEAVDGGRVGLVIWSQSTRSAVLRWCNPWSEC
jgi:hypothetical protein